LIFQLFSKLRIAISLKLSPSTVCTGTGVISKFRKWEILVIQKIRQKNFDFFEFFQNGMEFWHQPVYGDRGLYEMAAKSWRFP